MDWIFIDIAIIAAFLYYRRNKAVAASSLSKNTQYVRLWLLPLFQLAICVFFLFFSYMTISVLSSESPYMDQIIKDNLGIFSSITSDMFNDYRTDKLAPFIEECNKVHKYAIYLFYVSIASLAFHVFVLKSKVCSKNCVLYTGIVLSILILIVGYLYYYYSDFSFSELVSTETLGIHSSSKEKAVKSAIGSISNWGVILFFFHYYHNIWLRKYYKEVDKTSITTIESFTETDIFEEQSDDKKYQNLKDLKALLDAGVLTREEFDAQKKEILNL